uniref:Protein kinase domain-containing protein n=1 Tax=Meloidogyne javanica TaxID=6303 RepID=A0A915LKI1_MELJA
MTHCFTASSTYGTDNSTESTTPLEKKDDNEGKKEKKDMKSQRKIEYQDLILMAKSGQGDAWKAIAKEKDGNTKVVVIKALHAPFLSPAAAKYTLRELTLLSTLKHPNLISLYDIRIPTKIKPLKKFDELHFVTEYFGRTLSERISEKKRLQKVWTHQELSYCIMQILCGAKYLHESGIVHRDLKPTNIVMNERGNVKILDYGIARDILPENLTPDAGTPFYRAPELFLGINSYDRKVDIWSIGCIFAELISGKILFTGITLSSQWRQFIELLGSSPSDLEFTKSLNLKKTQRTVIENIEERPPIDWERFIPDGAIPKLISEFLTIGNVRQLLSSMLVLDPFKRTDANNALSNHYFDIYRGYLSANLLAKPEKIYDFQAEIKTLQTNGNNLDKWKVVFLPPQPYFNEPLGNYSSDIEHYSMNGVELTNILPHMKDNLRNYLFNNANIALIKATNLLRIFNTNFYEEHFEGGPADSPWHGIQIKTDETNNNSIILSLSVTNKIYQLGKIEEFFIEFGREKDFRRPYRNIPQHTSRIDTGSNQCRSKHISKTITPLKGFKAKKSIVIKLTTDKYSRKAEFALQAKDGSNLVDIYITNKTILFGPGDAEGHWYPSKVKLTDSQEILEAGKEIKITIQAFVYHIVIIISGFPKMVSTFWPFFWWKQMPYMAVSNVLMTGDFALLRSVEMIDFDVN